MRRNANMSDDANADNVKIEGLRSRESGDGAEEDESTATRNNDEGSDEETRVNEAGIPGVMVEGGGEDDQ